MYRTNLCLSLESLNEYWETVPFCVAYVLLFSPMQYRRLSLFNNITPVCCLSWITLLTLLSNYCASLSVVLRFLVKSDCSEVRCPFFSITLISLLFAIFCSSLYQQFVILIGIYLSFPSLANWMIVPEFQEVRIILLLYILLNVVSLSSAIVGCIRFSIESAIYLVLTLYSLL